MIAGQQGPVSLTFSCLQFKFDWNFATNFSTCHDSTAVVPCTKFCSDHCIRTEVSETIFPSNLICDEKTVSQTGPWVQWCTLIITYIHTRDDHIMRDLQSLRTPVSFTFHSDLTLPSHCCSDCLQSVFVAVCMISGCLAKCLIVYNPAIMSRTCINDSLYMKALTFLIPRGVADEIGYMSHLVAISHVGRSTFKVGIKLVSGNHLTWYGYPFTFFCGHSEPKTLTTFTSTHWVMLKNICISELSHHWFR